MMALRLLSWRARGGCDFGLVQIRRTSEGSPAAKSRAKAK
jgi:hypothetical protein